MYSHKCATARKETCHGDRVRWKEQEETQQQSG